MKLSMIVSLFVSLFGAGLVFFRLNSHFTEQKFRLTLKTAAASVWVSVGLWAAVQLLHHRVMLIGEHLIFDALGSLLLAIMLSCGLALLREAGFLRFLQAESCKNDSRPERPGHKPLRGLDGRASCA